MNICQSLIEAAARASGLPDHRREHIIDILLDHQQPDGGFKGKGKTSDLYYTGFAVLSLIALEASFDQAKIIRYLEDFHFAESTDLAHRAAWIRVMKLLKPGYFTAGNQIACMDLLMRYGCEDGAWHHLGNERTGSAYGCFLFIGACQDLGWPIHSEMKAAILHCVNSLETGAGGYINEKLIPAAAVPSTAAAMMVRHILQGDAADLTKASEWISKNYSGEGFRVMPFAPLPDLLSTAVALHALALNGTLPDAIKRSCMDYVYSLWDDHLGFCANAIDKLSDTEYMFYGLLALGHLVQ